ncbi:MAG: ADP-ribosylglycohydrolase family protein [Halobacteriaceae archaeon]
MNKVDPTQEKYVFAEETIPDKLPDPLFLTPDHGLLHFEYNQLQEAGRDFNDLESKIETAFSLKEDDPKLEKSITDILLQGPELPIKDGFEYTEPSELPEIKKSRPTHTPQGGIEFDQDTVREHIHGGWIGACAGCLLGKPVQGWSQKRIREFLKASNQYPLTEYIHADVRPEIRDKYNIYTNLEERDSFITDVDGMPIDDDIDYIVAGLQILENNGLQFDSIDVANYWVEHLPLFNTYTAERVAYRNFANRIMPPDSATHLNPYREMIGAQIRADPWGYISLGNPTQAAALAYRDARISHIKNGIYGEMWVAAMIAGAPLATDIEDLIQIGLSEIPINSRLTESIQTVIEWYETGIDVETAQQRIHDRWDETDMYDWVHVRSNTEIITMALLWSGGDFSDAITTAVDTGFDTDSHAASVGSILGTYHGVSNVPEQWITPLQNNLTTSISNIGTTTISSLADRTVDVWNPDL